MPNYTSSHQGSWHDDQFIKTEVFDKIYPIGSVYISVNSTNPSSLFGGTWVQIEDTFLLACGSNHSAGSTGGEEKHILLPDEVPIHTHTRGTMNITGQAASFGHTGNVSYGLNMDGSNWSGAFYSYASTNCYANSPYSTLYNSSQHHSGFKFEASRSWTGETSSFGGGLEHNNMPPYLAVYMWKRTA